MSYLLRISFYNEKTWRRRCLWLEGVRDGFKAEVPKDPGTVSTMIGSTTHRDMCVVKTQEIWKELKAIPWKWISDNGWPSSD
jgi:hypothetical protein